MYARSGQQPAQTSAVRPDIVRKPDTDPAAAASIPIWVEKTGHSLIVDDSSAGCRYIITRSR